MRLVRTTWLSIALLCGCFSEPSSSGGADGSSGGEATGSTSTTGSSGQPETTDEGPTGSSGTTGFGSGFDTTGTTSEPMACDGDSRCLPTIQGWEGPLEIIATSMPEMSCPNMAPPEWRSNADVVDPVCDCACSSPEGSCDTDVTLHDSSCGVPSLGSFTLLDGECVVASGVGDFPLGLQPTNLVADASCAAPLPPEPTFATSVVACRLPTTGTCDAGDCVPQVLGPQSRVCVVRPGNDGAPCPAPYSERSMTADSASADGLDCSGCDCTPTNVSCGGLITAFSDGLCMSPASTPSPIGDADCVSMSPTNVDDVAGLRYDSNVMGTCEAAQPTADAQGSPTLDGVRTLCCL